MHILYLHQFFTTREGTGGTRSYEFARHLAGAGHDVTMVTAARGMPPRDRASLLDPEVPPRIERPCSIPN
ncbi:MAG: hypothetical protein WKF40_05370 [Thermoleophilaceae bacterium]